MQHTFDDESSRHRQSDVRRARLDRALKRVVLLPISAGLLFAFFLLLMNAPTRPAQAAPAPIPIPAFKPDLWIIKTGPLTATIGSQVVYTIFVGNSGAAVANNVTVTDQTPAGLTFVGFSGDCTGMTCNFASLNQSLTLSKTIRATFNIPPDYNLIAKPIITNTASITSATPENNLFPNTAYWGSLPISIADLVLTKTASSDLVARGENVTYTLHLANIGPSNAISVSVLDVMTPTLPFVAGTSGDCSFAPVLTGTIILCNNLPVGSSYTITAVHAVPLDWVTTTVKNTGLAGSFSYDPNYYNNVSSQTITITSRADMSITKEAPEQVVPGTDTIFTLTVKNLGPSKAQMVTVSDPGFNALTPVVGAPCAGGFPCALGTMWPQSSTQIVMTFTVPSSLTDTQVVNIAGVTSTITDPVEINNASTVTVPVVRISDLDITKEAPATAVPGELITYTMVVTNNGPSDAAEVTLTDLDPISLTAQGSPCVAGVCSLPNLPTGVSTTLTLSYSIDAFARGTVTNTASVTSTGAPTPTEATVTTTLLAQADLAISKTDDKTEAAFGTPVTYTIVVTNNGPSGVVDAPVSDTLPALLNGTSWSCVAVSPDACAPASGTGDINLLARLAPNGVLTITAGGTLVTASDMTQLQNTATITVPADVSETNPQNNSNTDTTDLVYVADLSITKTATPSDTIAPGELLTYVLTVGNAGPSKAESAIVTDYLPWALEGQHWVCVAGAGASCSTASGYGWLTGKPITLEPGSLVTFTITGTLRLEARGSIYNYASVSVKDDKRVSDPIKDNNWSDVSVPIQSKAFIGIGKSDGQTIAVPGTMLTYVITLSNEGPSVANGVLYDIFPPGLENAVWAWTYAGKAMVMGDINNIVASPGVTVEVWPQSSLTVTVSATLQLTATGWLTNVAQFAIGNETPGDGPNECDIPACSLPLRIPGGLPNEGESKPIINTNPITQAIDVDAIVPAQVTGMVYNDLNGNGVFNVDEPALTGVQVVITGNGVSAVTVVVDAGGLFTQTVPPGAFSRSVVAASVPAGFVLTGGNADANGVAAAGSNWSGYIGYQGRGAVNGVAFNDVNGNGTREGGEVGLPGVAVTLTPQAAMSIASVDGAIVTLSTTTDVNGNYAFNDVPAANYSLNANAPAGFVKTTPLPQNVNVTPASSTTKDLGFQSPGVLVITKQAQTSGNGNVLGADRLVTFTLSITNNGAGLLKGVVVTDVLESYLQYVDGSATPAPLSTAPLVWQVGDLQPGQGTSVRFATQVSAGFGGTVVNTAKSASTLTQQVLSNEVVVHPAPTSIALLRFTAQRDGDGVRVEWATGVERNTYGFNVFRSETGNRADAVQVNVGLIEAGAKDGQYTFVDGGAEAGKTYTYWLQEIELVGSGVIDYLAYPVTVQPAIGQGMTRTNVFIPLVVR